MGSMLSRIVAVSYGIETTYGVGTPDPLFSSCNLMFRNGNLLSVDQEVIDLAELRASLTKSGDAIGRTLYRITPGHVLMGHGGAMTTFRLANVLKMCGMIETISGSSCTYKFRSSSFSSGVVNVEMAGTGADSINAKLAGVYGTFQMAGAAGQPITIDPTLTGIFATPTYSGTTSGKSVPANTVETMKGVGFTIKPETSQGSNTFGAALTGSGASTIKLKSFTLDAGIDIQEDKDANAANALFGLLLSNRKPTASVVVGLDSTLYDDFILHMQSGQKHLVSFTHGSGAGKKCKFTWYGQITSVELQDDVGLRTAAINYQLAWTTDDAELELEFT